MSDYKPKYTAEIYLRFLKEVDYLQIRYTHSMDFKEYRTEINMWFAENKHRATIGNSLEHALDYLIDQAIKNKEFDIPKITIGCSNGLKAEIIGFADCDKDDPTSIENVLDFLTKENKYLHEVKRKYKEENALLKTQIALMKKRLMNHLPMSDRPIMPPLGLNKPKSE